MLRRISLIVIFAGVLAGQSGGPVSFESADVRISPQKPNLTTVGGVLRGRRYEFRNATLIDLISNAYGIPPNRVRGDLTWLLWDRFDVSAVAPADVSLDAAKVMLRTLLAERFKLVIHDGSAPLPLYALTAGKGVVHFREGNPVEPAGCRIQNQNPSLNEIPYVMLSCRNVSMASFAQSLRQFAPGYIDQPIEDFTALKGTWDLDLKWSTKEQLAAAGREGISLFDAVDRQLGLKLQLQTAPFPVLIVDSAVETPTSNPLGTIESEPRIPSDFEAADIKPSLPRTNQSARFFPGGKLNLQGMTLKNLILFAWNANSGMVVTPNWIDAPKFNIIAEASTDPALSQADIDGDTMRAMLRRLLINRFKIAMHTENRPVLVYTLVRAKRSGSLKKTNFSHRGGCRQTERSAIVVSYICQNITMTRLIEELPQIASPYIDLPVVDSTGMRGGWDLNVSWTPWNAFTGSETGGATRRSGSARLDQIGTVTFYDALEKQAGLKLKVQTQTMPVIVVDHIEALPTPN